MNEQIKCSSCAHWREVPTFRCGNPRSPSHRFQTAKNYWCDQAASSNRVKPVQVEYHPVLDQAVPSQGIQLPPPVGTTVLPPSVSAEQSRRAQAKSFVYICLCLIFQITLMLTAFGHALDSHPVATWCLFGSYTVIAWNLITLLNHTQLDKPKTINP